MPAASRSRTRLAYLAGSPSKNPMLVASFISTLSPWRRQASRPRNLVAAHGRGRRRRLGPGGAGHPEAPPLHRPPLARRAPKRLPQALEAPPGVQLAVADVLG